MRSTIGCLALIFCLLILPSCATTRPRLLPAPHAPDFESFVSADALVREGCLACLYDALSVYERLAASPAFPSARLRAADTAILVALREREIGLDRSSVQAKAHALAASLPVPYDLSSHLAMLDVVPWKAGSTAKERQDEMLGAFRTLTWNQLAWRRILQRDDDDLLRASLRLSLECTYRGGFTDPKAPEPWRPAEAAAPLLRFRAAFCLGSDTKPLTALLEANPRFTEIELLLGELSFGQGRLLEAERHMLAAFAAFPESALAASYLGSIYMTMEDFEAGLPYYQKAVALIPGHREALLGEMKLLSYLSRAEEAIRVADRMIELGTWYLGDAYYWRALNRLQLKDVETAWSDVLQAKKYLPTDGAVAKLTGQIALARNEPARAEEEFRIAIKYNDKDSDAWFYLGSVVSTFKRWKEAAGCFESAEPLYAKDESRLRAKVTEIAESKLPDERKARLTATKQRQIAATVLQQARSAFSAAAGYFNCGEFEKARLLAERAAANPDMADSAKKILERLPRKSLPE